VKILAPLRHSEEVMPLVEAGADEFYCGVVPPDWQRRFGSVAVHRRSTSTASATTSNASSITPPAGLCSSR
jgi:hypothetical protein